MRLGAVVTAALVITSSSAPAQERPNPQPRAPFEPKLSIAAPPPAWMQRPPATPKIQASPPVVHHGSAAASLFEKPEVICGIRVVRKGAELDPGILVQAERTDGLAIRRIAPPVCPSSR